jgi:hypothetical protein
MTFSFPNYLDSSVISELENSIIDICNKNRDFEHLLTASAPLWSWAGSVLNKTPQELRHEIETHEADEHFSDQYHEEKDHLLKLPLLFLERINSR